MNKIYNVGAHGIPPKVVTEIAGWRLTLHWGEHARQEMRSDKYGRVAEADLPFRFSADLRWKLVEVETRRTERGETVCKFVVRRYLDAGRDLVLVIIPDGPGLGFVKTAWINLTTDTHRSLDKTRFDRP